MSSSFHTTEKSFPSPSYKFERKSTRKAEKPICIRSELVYGYDGNSAQYANNSCDPNMIVKELDGQQSKGRIPSDWSCGQQEYQKGC
ncbi:hypothetical protein B9Z55_029133 [Caenorhabditis nigoni]|uniref:Uncharacterized protein n=1 Tax=Caenorhabditis nigoni TaxID=1611254 RepID=A0A2G5S8W2_9PELO|nr:hypothetical protein B9Z55_029133 [Caenorhabditis nigoni]